MSLPAERMGRAGADLAMIAERFPQLAPKIAEKMEEAMEPVKMLLAYLRDEITEEEWDAYKTEHDAADRAAREERYGEGPVYELECMECGEPHTWDREEEDDMPPPLWFECEDVTGESCVEEDDDDDE